MNKMGIFILSQKFGIFVYLSLCFFQMDIVICSKHSAEPNQKFKQLKAKISSYHVKLIIFMEGFSGP